MNSNKHAVSFFLLFWLALSGTCWGGSKLINVQGKLLNSQGNPLNGPYTITFRIYTTPTGHAGNCIYQQDPNCIWSESQGVTVTNGAINVTMGKVSPLDPIPFNAPYYLGMQVAGDANELTPRQLLGASAYSLGSLGDFNVKSNLIVNGESSMVPAGTILPFAGLAAPTGFLICDGSAVSRTTYSALFAALSTVWGSGDGQTTFNIPDMRGRAPIGAGQGVGLTNRTVAQALGEEAHTLTLNEIPAHSHAITDPGHGHSITDPGHHHTYLGGTSASILQQNGGSYGAGGGLQLQVPRTGTDSATTGISIVGNTTGISVNNAGGGAAHNTMPPSAVVNFIIKT